ncbi:hypothetical protein OUZ56_010664 [Daphnia magna]|uniref:Uncharacterized protein n=1 Tax=Daphnia magna TaxID=35525 RepID=A0ABR0AJ95_9CRUS|nr:hypothetical protein OUZ56_010664 [Daphnia magna]
MWYTFEAMQLLKLPEVVVKDRHGKLGKFWMKRECSFCSGCWINFSVCEHLTVVDMNLRLCAVKKLINLPYGEKISGLNFNPVKQTKIYWT